MLLSFSGVVSVVAIRHILLARLDERIGQELTQEAGEFRRLSRGVNPSTGQPFGRDIRALFDLFLSRNIPAEGEELLTFDRGRPYKVVRAKRATYPLDSDPAFVAHWTSLRESEHGEFETPAGPARYLAVPVTHQGRRLGTFVVSNFIEGEREEVTGAIRVTAIVIGSVLLLGSFLAFLAAGRVLAPLRGLSETARSISEADLTRRINVHGNDEIADLGRTFNAMLDRLEAAFGSQRAFISDVSHELRTPLTIVRGHLELLGDDPEEKRATVHLVTDELDRMNRFVDDLLVLAKAERPDFLVLEEFDLDVFTEEVIVKARTLADREWELGGFEPRVVLADRQRLVQAVINLAENAAHQTGPGDRIEIGSAVVGSEACLWVADSGTGIPYSDRDRIFGRFARGAPGGRHHRAGAGLGLAIVKAIAEAHGGRIELESEEGRGSTFTVIVPTREPDEHLPAGGAVTRRVPTH